MATEEAIREAIVEAVRGISGDLGFDELGGNIRVCFYEYEAEEDRSDSLMASVDSEPRVRRWGVQVTGSDRWSELAFDTITRTYRVQFEALYEVGTALEADAGLTGFNLLVKHARKVRGAVAGLGSMLGYRVDTMGPMSELSVAIIRGVEPSDGQILRGLFGFTAEKAGPDF